MRILSHLTLGVALLTGTALLVPAEPVEAKKKKKKKKGKAEKDPYAISVSKEFQPAYKLAADALAVGDLASAEANITAAEAFATTADDRFAIGSVRLNIGTAKKDNELRRRGINEMLATGRTSPAKVPVFTFYSGLFAYAAKDYATAIPQFKEAIKLGYTKGGIFLNLAEANFNTKAYAEGLHYLDQAIALNQAEGKPVPQAWYQRGAGISQRSKDKALQAAWMLRLVKAFPKPEFWRNALYSYRNTTSLSSQENLDLMRLLRKTGGMTSQRDYGEYVDAADTRSLPGEVLAVINEGLADGVFDADDDYSKEVKAEVSSRVQDDKASLPASEKDALKSANGKIAMATADAYLGYGNFAKATALYAAAVDKGGVDANRANMRAAISMVGAGDLAAAKAKFATVTGKRAGISKLWTAWIDSQMKKEAAPLAAETATPAS